MHPCWGRGSRPPIYAAASWKYSISHHRCCDLYAAMGHRTLIHDSEETAHRVYMHRYCGYGGGERAPPVLLEIRIGGYPDKAAENPKSAPFKTFKRSTTLVFCFVSRSKNRACNTSFHSNISGPIRHTVLPVGRVAPKLYSGKIVYQY